MNLTARLTDLAHLASDEAAASSLRSLATRAAEVTPDECFYASIASVLDEIESNTEYGWVTLRSFANDCRAESRRLIAGPAA